MDRVLEAYGLQPVRGLIVCPFHTDKHPSCRVYRDGYYCFSCGAGGDAVTFVARMDGVGNQEAARRVMEIGRMDAPEADYRGKERCRQAQAARREKERRVARDKEAYRSARVRRLELVAIIADGVPYSDEWAGAALELPHLEGLLDELFERLAHEQ